MRNFSMGDRIWENPGHELDEMAAYIIGDRKIVFAGSEREVMSYHAKNSEITAYAALLLEKSGGQDTVDLPDVDWEELDRHRAEYMIVAVTEERGEYERLEAQACGQHGFERNKSFFQGEVFEIIWNLYNRNKLYIDRIEIFLTPCCTLNCEKCIAFIPYFKDKKPTALEKLKEDADLLFARVDYVRKLKLLGGEGFLYPHLVQYMDYLYEQYEDRIGEVRVGTNGTVTPDEEVLECCRKHKVIVDISDYTHAVPEQCRLDKMKQLFEENGVAYDVKRIGEQWLDMGFPTENVERKSEKQLLEHFWKCAMFCRNFYDGKLWFCCSNFAAVRSGLFPEDENDFLDFRKEVNKKVLAEYELGYSRNGYTTFCRECNGCSEEANQRHVEVARQLRR